MTTPTASPQPDTAPMTTTPDTRPVDIPLEEWGDSGPWRPSPADVDLLTAENT